MKIFEVSEIEFVDAKGRDFCVPANMKQRHYKIVPFGLASKGYSNDNSKKLTFCGK